MLVPVRVAILVPTRNRPEMAVRAARSVLAQGDPRVQVVVSDNSDPESRARLAGAASAAGVDAIFAKAASSMTDHWNWALDEVLERCTPTHVGIVTDRFVYKPGALTPLLDRVVEAHPDDIVVHNHDRVEDVELPAAVILEPGSGAVYRSDFAALLASVASGQAWNWETPRMMNSLIPVRIFEALRARNGRVFGSTAPDHYFGYWVAALEESYLCWDASPSVHYAMSRSNGYAQMSGVVRSDDAKDFSERISGLALLSPFPDLRTISNFMFHEYSVVAQESGSSKFRPLGRDAAASAIRRDTLQISDAAVREQILRAVGPGDSAPPSRFRTYPLAALRYWCERAVGRVLSVPAPRSVVRWTRANGRVVARLRFENVDDALAAASRANRRDAASPAPVGAGAVVTTDVWP